MEFRRVRAVLVGVMVAVLAACGGAGDRPGGRAGAPAEAGGAGDAVTTTQAGVATSSAPRSSPTPRAGGSGRTSDGGSPGPADSGVTENAEDPVYALSRRAPGQLAGPLLRPAPKGAKRIVYQRMVQSGKEPDASAIDHVVAILRRVSGKVVEIPPPVVLPAGPDQWSTNELHAYADRYTRQRSSTDAAVLNVLFVGGEHEQSDSILGAATRADVITMFPDRYRNLGFGLNPQAIEVSVLTHEVGHLLSLVGGQIRPERQDKERPGHSRNKESVMYWAVETDDIINAFVGAPPKTFDREDLADLETIRNS